MDKTLMEMVVLMQLIHEQVPHRLGGGGSCHICSRLRNLRNDINRRIQFEEAH